MIHKKIFSNKINLIYSGQQEFLISVPNGLTGFQREVLLTEFTEYSLGLDRISEVDFAKFLVRFANLKDEVSVWIVYKSYYKSRCIFTILHFLHNLKFFRIKLECLSLLRLSNCVIEQSSLLV